MVLLNSLWRDSSRPLQDHWLVEDPWINDVLGFILVFVNPQSTIGDGVVDVRRGMSLINSRVLVLMRVGGCRVVQ